MQCLAESFLCPGVLRVFVLSKLSKHTTPEKQGGLWAFEGGGSTCVSESDLISVWLSLLSARLMGRWGGGEHMMWGSIWGLGPKQSPGIKRLHIEFELWCVCPCGSSLEESEYERLTSLCSSQSRWHQRLSGWEESEHPMLIYRRSWFTLRLKFKLNLVLKAYNAKKKTSAGQRLIAINCILNKSFCVHNICVCPVYICYVYIKTHIHCKNHKLRNVKV